MHTVEIQAGVVEYAVWRRTTPPPASGAYVPAWNTGVPLAVPGIALLGVILLLIRRHRKLRQLQRPGLCPSCGYDLRATPGRCPECGTGAPASGTDIPTAPIERDQMFLNQSH